MHDELEEREEELRLTNYKVNKPELEVLAKQLIELRRQIAERAKRQEELRAQEHEGEEEQEPPRRIELKRRFQR